MLLNHMNHELESKIPKNIKKHLNHFQPLWTSCSGCHKARLCQRSLPSCRGHAERNPVWCHGWLMRRALPQRSDIPSIPGITGITEFTLCTIYESIRGKGWIYEDLRQLMFDIVWRLFGWFMKGLFVDFIVQTLIPAWVICVHCQAPGSGIQQAVISNAFLADGPKLDERSSHTM